VVTLATLRAPGSQILLGEGVILMNNTGQAAPIDRIVMEISSRDLEHLSDCDDMVSDLLGQATSVSLHFDAKDLAWVHGIISPEYQGWGMRFSKASDVKIERRFEGNALVLTYKHRRGL
jgi:hypothetical protein